MKTRVIGIGAGGHAKGIIEMMGLSNHFRLVEMCIRDRKLCLPLIAVCMTRSSENVVEQGKTLTEKGALGEQSLMSWPKFLWMKGL